MKPGKLRIARFTQLTAPACAALLLYPVATRAIGPDTQIIQDADAVNAPTLNDVCALGYMSGGKFVEIGSGSTIGYQVNTNGSSLSYVFSILTADHVPTPPPVLTTVEWGSGNSAGPYAGLSYLMTASINGYVDCPDPNIFGGTWHNGIQDLAVVDATVTVNMNNPAAGMSEQAVVANNLFTLAPYVTVTPTATNSNSGALTELGYSGGAGAGGGIWNGVRYNNFTAAFSDARRFQNTTNSGIIGAGGFKGLVGWTVQSPSPAGGGASFAGDSGGPYLFGGSGANTSYPTNTTVNPGYPTTTNGTHVNFTDYLEAVHVAGDNGQGPATPGAQGYGEPLVETGNAATGSYDWVEQYAGAYNNEVCLIPEPGVATLLVVGVGCCLARRRTRA